MIKEEDENAPDDKFKRIVDSQIDIYEEIVLLTEKLKGKDYREWESSPDFGSVIDRLNNLWINIIGKISEQTGHLLIVMPQDIFALREDILKRGGPEDKKNK